MHLTLHPSVYRILAIVFEPNFRRLCRNSASLTRTCGSSTITVALGCVHPATSTPLLSTSQCLKITATRLPHGQPDLLSPLYSLLFSPPPSLFTVLDMSARVTPMKASTARDLRLWLGANDLTHQNAVSMAVLQAAITSAESRTSCRPLKVPLSSPRLSPLTKPEKLC